MTDGIATTFRTLTETRNEAALGVLIPAMESVRAEVRNGALEAVLARRSPAGLREVIKRLHLFDERSRGIMEDHCARMTQVLRDAVLSCDHQMCHNGCRATLWFREYDLVPALITALEDSLNPNTDLVGRTLLELCQRLDEELGLRDDGGRRRDARAIRARAVGALESSLRRFGNHRRREVVEAFVMLARRSNAALRQILKDPHHSAFIALMDSLSRGTSGGVIRLLLSFLDDPQAPSVPLSVISKRCDLTLVRQLLARVGPDPSKPMLRNLKRIHSVAWIRDRVELLDDLDDRCQQAAVRLVMASGIPRQQAFRAVKHVLLRGQMGGRRVAAEALDAFHGAEANHLALVALDDADPQVQANVLVQLRRRGIPGAMTRLVDRIDSPYEVVRSAARSSLAEFSFPRFVAAFDMLEDEVRTSTGELVKKVDPDTVPLLQAEMESRLRTRRLRGLAIAQTLDLIEPLEPAIIALLEDEDHMVRSQAAAALADSTTPASLAALQAALGDPSTIVQEAARSSMEERRELSRTT